MYWKVTTLVLFVVTVFFGCKHSPPEKQINQNPTGGIDNPCDPDTVYFVNDVLPLLTSSCAYAGCHDAASRQDGVNLSTYATILASADVEPGSPRRSDLYEVITENDPDKVMPPPPASKLTQEQIDKIAKWIEQGAKNNQCADCDTTNVKYSTHIRKILSNNCIGCHSASNSSGGINLSNYSNVKAEVDNAKLTGVINHLPGFKPMPPSGVKLNECDLHAVEIWIKNGALND